MEIMKRGASGVAKGGLTTGIIGTALGGLNTLALLGGGAALAGMGSGWNRSGNTVVDVLPSVPMAGAFAYGYPGVPFNAGNCGCNEDHCVTRYDAQKDAEIAALKSDKALLEANTYQDQKSLEMYKYIDGRFREFEQAVAQQAVINQANRDRFDLLQQEQKCCCEKTQMMIANEAERRCCADQNIVNYMNATFVPQTIQEPAAGTTTYRQPIWNPLPGECGCNFTKPCPQQ